MYEKFFVEKTQQEDSFMGGDPVYTPVLPDGLLPQQFHNRGEKRVPAAGQRGDGRLFLGQVQQG